MQQTYGLERIGLMNPKVVYRNMSPAWLTEQALLNGEGVLSDTGALVVRTGKYTGRAPDDKFIVDTPSIHDYIAWNNINRPISKEKFNASFGRQRKNWPSMANRTSLSSSPRASSAIRRATAPIPRRPSSSTTNRVPSSSPVRAMPGKSRRASFRS